MGNAQPKSKYDRETGVDADRGSLSSYIKNLFEDFKTSRKPWEDIWIECWNNYLGQYQVSTQWKKEKEGVEGRSKVFIKLTTLKCNTAHAKLMDGMFPGRTDVPFDTTPIEVEKFGIPAEVATKAASKMKERLKDHFRKIELEETIDEATLECAILGTAVLKGPIVEVRKIPRIQKKMISGIEVDQLDSEINPYEIINEEEVVPTVDLVPLWSYYVDVNASSPADSIGEIQFKRLLPAQFKQLARQGGYKAEAVRDAAERATLRDMDDPKFIQLGDNYMGEKGDKDMRVSVLEYWGLVPVEMLKEAGCDIPEDVDESDSIEALVVLAADGIVIKACVNPLGRRPFNVCPYKKRPGVIYGQGVSEAMRDSQMMINSSARMIIDNKALSGNGMVAINLDRINTKRTRDFKVYPRKTWFIKGNFKPKDAIDSVQFEDVTKGLQELMQMFERFADEETGIPKYAQGEQGSFLNKTATGMSMLMTQANINLKTVMKNIDNYWIEPLVEAFYDWFMEMDPDNEIKIPLKIKATGTDSLVAKEIKVEQYMKYAQTFSNPQDAIFMDRIKLMKIIAENMEVSDIVRSDDEIEKLMKQMAADPPDKDLREYVDLAKLYPFLARSEQMQILEDLGVTPDPTATQPGAPATPSGATSSPAAGVPAPSFGGNGGMQ